MTARYDIAALKTRLGSIKAEDNPALVRQKSRDFYWYSPILKRQLDHVTADIVASPKTEAEVVQVLQARVRTRHPGHPARHRHGQLRPGNAPVGRNRARSLGLQRRQGRSRRAGSWPSPGRIIAASTSIPVPFRPGDPAAPIDLQHRVDRRLHRRRLGRGRLDQMGRAARFRQYHPPEGRHDGGRARACSNSRVTISTR